VGQLGDVALNAQGSPMGGGGSSGGAPAGGGGGLDLSFLLGPLGQFAGLLDAINPIAALVAGVMKVLQPAIQTLIYPLVRVGSILAQAFMPVLQALFPVFKLLGIAVLAVGIGIGEVWNAIASAINAVLGWLGVNLPKLDMKVLYNGMSELINMTWDEADARDKLAGKAPPGLNRPRPGERGQNRQRHGMPEAGCLREIGRDGEPDRFGIAVQRTKTSRPQGKACLARRAGFEPELCLSRAGDHQPKGARPAREEMANRIRQGSIEAHRRATHAGGGHLHGKEQSLFQRADP
jgi:hypothetical protein